MTYLPVKTNGIVDLQTLADAIRPDTSLISVMYVNNEIGVCQPIKVSSLRYLFFANHSFCVRVRVWVWVCGCACACVKE